MRFNLDKILTDDILFYMENQDGDFLLDTKEAKIVNFDNYDDDPEFAEYAEADEKGDIDKDAQRYISLPEWDTNDGFRLMEKFTVELKNPVIRHELSAALNVKRGVFRSFKNVLEQYPETEKLWFNFKDRKMREVVIAWYNGLREEWGLEPIGSEPEDISAIILEDFVFREGKEGDAHEVSALHALCVEELKEKTKACVKETKAPSNLAGNVFLAAETASGDFCGYISAEKTSEYLQITRLEVKPEYRGMGIGKTLLAKFLSKLPEKAEGQGIIFDLPAGFEYFSHTLHIENFKPVMQRFLKIN